MNHVPETWTRHNNEYEYSNYGGLRRNDGTIVEPDYYATGVVGYYTETGHLEIPANVSIGMSIMCEPK